MARPGYYVEGRYYQDRLHQARARAAWLAQEYGRPVDIVFVPHDDQRPVQGDVISTVYNKVRASA